MNWITKIIKAGEKIKTAIRERSTKEDIAKSDWTSCCKGPILKKDLEENLWVCPDCKRHHRIKPHQRFDILFGKNNYEIFKTPIPKDDPLNWTDSKPYKERLKSARKKTGLECGMMVASGTINNINFIQLISPTTSKLRLKKIINDSHDMIYYISMLSTTGGKLKVSPKENIRKIQQN